MKYCDQPVCMSSSLSADISQKQRVQTLQNFLCRSTMAVAGCRLIQHIVYFSFVDNAMFPIIWCVAWCWQYRQWHHAEASNIM